MADRLLDLIVAFYDEWNYDPTGDTPARALAAALREHVVLREDLEQTGSLNRTDGTITQASFVTSNWVPVYRIREAPRIRGGMTSEMDSGR